MMLKPKIQEIENRRLSLNLLRSQLSTRAGLPPNAVGRIESGESKTVHPLRAKELAKAMHCKVDDIFETRAETA